MENTRLVIFDIDGTLLPGTSTERLFFHYLIDNKIMKFRNMLYLMLNGIPRIFKGKNFVLSANKGYLRGFSVDEMTKIGKSFFDTQVTHRISRMGIDRLNEHRDKGEIIFLLSGMPEFLIRNYSEFLKVENYLGSELEVKSGRFTGRTLGTFPISKGKAKVAESIMNRFGVPREKVTAYADFYGDRYMLDKVGHPIVVNPDPNLALVAREKGWPVEIFD